MVESDTDRTARLSRRDNTQGWALAGGLLLALIAGYALIDDDGFTGYDEECVSSAEDSYSRMRHAYHHTGESPGGKTDYIHALCGDTDD